MTPLNRILLALLAMLALGACQSIPYARFGEIPPAVRPVDGSPERRALNAEVYDAATDYVARLFYRRDFGGMNWRGEAAAHRAAAVAQPDEASFYVALEHLLERLDDDHTNAQSPTERVLVEARRAGEAIATYGFITRPEGDERYVGRVLPDTPASEARVQPGWRIVSADGVAPHLAPPAIIGRETALVFEDRDGGRIDLSLMGVEASAGPRRDLVTLPSGVVVLRFDDFDRPTLSWAQEVFAAFAEAPPPGMIIDLRGNGGGYFDVTALMLGHLFDRQVDVSVWQGRIINRRWNTDPATHVYDGPLAVLIGPGSASGAEVFAAVIKEEGRGVLIGETTRGAVIGARTVNLPDGGGLTVGMIEMLTPRGFRIEGVGVTPDIVIANDWDAVARGEDPTMQAAGAVLRVARG